MINGRSLESLLCIQRGTTERSDRKKGKSNSEAEKTHGGRARSEGGGGGYVLLLIRSWRFRGHKLHLISCWLSSSGADRVCNFKVGFIRTQRWSAVEIWTICGARLETPALEFSALFPRVLTPLFITPSVLWWTIYNTARSRRLIFFFLIFFCATF